jgi:hypothetical protein
VNNNLEPSLTTPESIKGALRGLSDLTPEDRADLLNEVAKDILPPQSRRILLPRRLKISPHRQKGYRNRGGAGPRPRGQKGCCYQRCPDPSRG